MVSGTFFPAGATTRSGQPAGLRACGSAAAPLAAYGFVDASS